MEPKVHPNQLMPSVFKASQNTASSTGTGADDYKFINLCLWQES